MLLIPFFQSHRISQRGIGYKEFCACRGDKKYERRDWDLTLFVPLQGICFHRNLLCPFGIIVVLFYLYLSITTLILRKQPPLFSYQFPSPSSIPKQSDTPRPPSAPSTGNWTMISSLPTRSDCDSHQISSWSS